MADQALGHLSNGHGGIDWAGLPFVVAMLGVTDVEDLVHRMGVLRNHRTKQDD